MKQEIKPATGRLGVLVVGVGGAVATTMIVGTLASRKGLAKPIGSITQLATMRMENNEEKLIKDVVPLTNLEDIVFGGWDIFPDNAYEAAMYAEVLKEKDLNGVKEELEAIKKDSSRIYSFNGEVESQSDFTFVNELIEGGKQRYGWDIYGIYYCYIDFNGGKEEGIKTCLLYTSPSPRDS